MPNPSDQMVKKSRGPKTNGGIRGFHIVSYCLTLLLDDIFLLSRVSPPSKVDIGLMSTWSYCWVTSETPPSPQVSRSRLRLIAVWVLVALNTGAADIDTEWWKLFLADLVPWVPCCWRGKFYLKQVNYVWLVSRQSQRERYTETVLWILAPRVLW